VVVFMVVIVLWVGHLQTPSYFFFSQMDGEDSFVSVND
jgi:hypothetical protein